jgi:hypothetical protein
MADGLNAGVDGTEHYIVDDKTGEVRLVIYDGNGNVVREEPIPAAAAKRVRGQIERTKNLGKPK